jgi:ATP-dependent Clp protease ATP-binding subunit ClpC
MKKKRHAELKINFDKFTNNARLSLAIADQYARERRFGEVCPEHVLLAVIRPSRDSAASGSSAESALSQLRAALNGITRSGTPSEGKLPHSADTKKMLRQAIVESQRLAHPKVGTEHLVLGLLVAAPSGFAAVELNRLGITLESSRLRLARLIRPSPTTGGEYLTEAEFKERQRLLHEDARRLEEAQREQELTQRLSDWREAKLIREFVAELKASAYRRGIAVESGSTLEAWINWAERRADRLDPIEQMLAAMTASPFAPKRR